MSDGHYNSVPSAEACQLDCQVDVAQAAHDDTDDENGDGSGS